MVGPRQKKTVEVDIKLAGNGKTFSRGLPKPLPSSLLGSTVLKHRAWVFVMCTS